MVVTGSFDIQVNGYAGADFCSRDLTLAQCRRACDELAADGTAGILATVITDSIEGICTKLAGLAALREQDPAIARMIAGFHVEGPFLSRKPG
jgi:N-acetylglucosamine-6-phosphate deacetylase